MFEQEIEMENKEGSSLGPMFIVLLLVCLFFGGVGVVIYQSRQTLKPEEASAAIRTQLQSAGPVTVTFHTGNVSLAAVDSPNDPHYKLLQKAGLIRVGKVKKNAANVELTPEGKTFLTSFPDVKGVPEKNGTLAYTLPLASRKLVAVEKINKIGQRSFQVLYTWAWDATKAGDIFDISGKTIQALPAYDRSVLIDQHGANYYHAAPIEAKIVVTKPNYDWQPGYPR